jgi:hypothetical protein
MDGQAARRTRFANDETEVSAATSPSLVRALWDSLSWGALIALGWLIYELTARPVFGVAVVCLKFGWEEFCTARWLLLTDPWRGRGRTCFLLFTATGLWKATAAAFVFTGSLLAVSAMLGGRLPRVLVPLGLTAAIGITLLAIIPLLGALCARHYGVKVWIDSTVHASRRHQVWPPVATGMNTFLSLLFPSLLLPIIATAVFAFPLGTKVVVTSVFAEVLGVWIVFRKVAARRPSECWEVAAIAPVPTDDSFEDDFHISPQLETGT